MISRAERAIPPSLVAAIKCVRRPRVVYKHLPQSFFCFTDEPQESKVIFLLKPQVSVMKH